MSRPSRNLRTVRLQRPMPPRRRLSPLSPPLRLRVREKGSRCPSVITLPLKVPSLRPLPDFPNWLLHTATWSLATNHGSLQGTAPHLRGRSLWCCQYQCFLPIWVSFGLANQDSPTSGGRCATGSSSLGQSRGRHRRRCHSSSSTNSEAAVGSCFIISLCSWNVQRMA